LEIKHLLDINIDLACLCGHVVKNVLTNDLPQRRLGDRLDVLARALT
jgi:hypothetical protein